MLFLERRLICGNFSHAIRRSERVISIVNLLLLTSIVSDSASMTLLFPLARWLCWSQVFTNNELTQTIKTYFYIFQSNIPHFRSMQSSKWWEFLYNLPTFHNRTNSLTKILSNHVQISNEHIQHLVLKLILGFFKVQVAIDFGYLLIRHM